MGVTVDMVPDRHYSSSFGKAVIRYASPMVGRFYLDFLCRELSRFGRSNYDTVLVIQGESVDITTLSWLRAAFPSANFNFYSWDNFANKPDSVLAALQAYDRVISFDEKDAVSYGTEFKPLFFSELSNESENSQAVRSYDYGLCFIGSIHSDRARIVSRFGSLCEKSDLDFFHYMYLQSWWVYYARKYFLRSTADFRRGDFHTRSLPFDVVNSISARSAALLDIEHPKQRGATMRTFETLALGRKLVTSNEAVRTLKIFSPENVFVFDRKRPKLPSTEFFLTPFRPIPKSVLNDYSLENWVRFVSSKERKSSNL